ncbi:MAG: acetyltransferase [Rhodospirillaceae bacterium]|nr:MAG: acetyltransferase [Rhodospirillaceae bacterium]
MRNFQIPTIPVIHRCLYGLHKLITGFIEWFLRVAYWTPLFKSRLENASPHLYLYGGMPLVTGPLSIRIGKDCRISGVTTFSGRWSSAPKPSLIIGDNVGIGWQTTIAVGSRVEIGNNVRIASRAFIAGYPGHPLNAKDRAAGLPDTDDQVGDIILDDDVWLGAGVTILAGVHVGAGTIIASASVVTRDLPAHVLAAGVPAKVIRSIEPEDEPNILECVQ